MKKLIALILCILLSLALAACTGEQEPSTQASAAPTGSVDTTDEEKGPFLVGYGRQDITPPLGVHLAGSTNPEERVATGILDNIYATCVAFTDADGETLLLYHMDLQRADQYAAYARLDLSKEFDIPIENIIISATHTHAAPNTQYYQNEKFPKVTMYMDEILFPAIMEAGRQALEDRKPAELYGASINPVNMNFNRHYLLSDGSVAGDIFGSFAGKTILHHMVEADDQLQALCFKREGGKDVVMVNWQAHPHKGGNKHPNVSADFISPMRDYLEAELDCNFAYFTGASGNVNSHSRIKSEMVTSDYVEHGEELARYALMALDSMEKLELGRIQVATFTSRASKVDMPISAFSIGDVGFAVAPYEMFSENGSYIKANSPFEMTFVVTCANGKFGYFPSEATYAYKSYEETANNIPKGNAEETAASFVDLLTGLYPDRYLPGQTAIPSRTCESPLYWNLDRGIERAKNADGSYTVRLMLEGQTAEYQVTDEALLARIDAQDLMGLTLDGSKIVAVHSLLDMPYERTTTAYYVEVLSGKNLVLNSHAGMMGRQVVVSLSDEVKLWDADKGGSFTGTLNSTHRVTTVCGQDGNVLCLFVSRG